jgi:hypothetical protein
LIIVNDTADSPGLNTLGMEQRGNAAQDERDCDPANHGDERSLRVGHVPSSHRRNARTNAARKSARSHGASIHKIENNCSLARRMTTRAQFNVRYSAMFDNGI